MTNQLINILPELLKVGLNRPEAVAAVRSVLSASNWQQPEKRIYNLTNGSDVVAQAVYNKHNCLTKLSVPQLLWSQAQAAIISDMSSPRTKVARTVMFSYRKLDAAYTVPGWIQIRPVQLSLKDMSGVGALSDSCCAGTPLPFVLEVEYQSSTLIFLESHRRITAVDKARFLLAALIDIHVFTLLTPYTWAFIDNSYALVRCGMADGLEEASPDSFSEVSDLTQLMPVTTEEYYNRLGVGSKDFCVPDLGYLYSNFMRLSELDQGKFLGCCANIHNAASPSIHWSQKLLLLVSAIEHLIDNNEQCDKCNSNIGVAKGFKDFLSQHVCPPPEVQAIYDKIYSNRSKITHGSWNPEVNEPFMSLHSVDETRGLTAWASAKKGALNWLIAQSCDRINAD